MDTITGYCVKCKSKGVELENAKIHKTPNGKYMAKGKHSCGTTVCLLMSEARANELIASGYELVNE